MREQETIAESFATTVWLVQRFTEGLTHADSVATPPFRANSFNWVLGHMLVSRDRALKLLQREAMLSNEERALYETGSDPVTSTTAVDLARLMDALLTSQSSLANGLVAATDAEMTRIVDADRDLTLKDRLKALHWHETYHLGQLEILRQVSREQDPYP